MESNNEFEYTGKGSVVPKNVTIVRFHPSVAEVEYEAFKGYKQLRVVVFNPSVVEVEYRAFRGCRNLSEVVFNDGLQKIWASAFYNCTSLSGVTLPSTVTEIGSHAFYNCYNLREVVFHDGLQKIGRYSFSSCTSLSSITIPSTVAKVGDGAFGNQFGICKKMLREVVFHGVPREIGQNAFNNITSLGRFTFPTISTRLDNLIRTGHWEEIENEVHEVRGVVEVSGGEFFVSTQTMRGGNNWNAVKQSLDKIIRLISCYELKEATSMLELALWKFKLDQVDAANPIPRKKCRMDAPGPVKDIILHYLR